MRIWSLTICLKILALRLALISSNIVLFAGRLLWWKYKNQFAEYLITLRARVGLALYYAQDELHRGEPPFRKGQNLRVLRHTTAQMVIAQNFEFSINVFIQPGELVCCVGRTPATDVDLVFSGDTDSFVARCIEHKDSEYALMQIRGWGTACFYVPLGSVRDIGERFAVIG